jgi:MFS family permease
LKNKLPPDASQENTGSGLAVAENRYASLLSRVKTFESFQSRPFSFYFGGMVGQWSAMNMQMVTNSLLAYRITGSGTILGIVALGNALPTLFLSLFGGVIADRMPKKILLQFGQAAAALVTLIIGIALLTGYMSSAHPESWWILLATSAFTGTVGAFTMPARQSIIPELVDRAHLMNAVSLNTMGMNIFRLASPAIAGFLIDSISFAAVYFIMAALFIIAIIFTGFLPKTATASSNRSNPLEEIKQGVKYVRGNSAVLFLLSFAFAVVLFFMPFQNLLPIFADDILKVGATGLGILMSVSGAGALTASIFFASIHVRRRGLIHILTTLTLSLALAVFAFSSNWTLCLILMIVIGVGQTGHVTTGTILLQSLTETQYMGRVMSLLVMNFGLSGLGTFLAGVLSDHISAQWTIGGFAMILILVSLSALIFARNIRKIN